MLRICRILILLLTLATKSQGQTTFVKHFSTKDGLPSNSCYYAMQDRKGYMWVATDAGVGRFDGKVFENFSIDDGLPDNQIVRLYEDKAGRIWFSALNGQLSYYFKGKIFNKYNEASLRLMDFDSIIISFFEDSRGFMWFGTNKNLLIRWDGKSIIKFVSARTSSQFITTSMYEDRQGRLWAISARCQHLFNGSTFVRMDGGPSPISFKTAINTPSKTLIYLDRHGLNVKDGKRQKLVLGIDSALLHSNPGYFYTENLKDIWLSNSTGIYHIDARGIKTHYLVNQVANQAIRDNKDNMWFCSANGLYMLPRKSKRIYVVDQTHGLSNNGIKSITKDRYNRLWLGMEDATMDILALPGYTVTCLNLPDKQRFNSIKQITPGADGKRLFFSSDYGLGMIPIDSAGFGHIEYLKEASNTGFVLKNFSVSRTGQMAIALSSGTVVLDDYRRNFSFATSRYRQGENFFARRAYRVFYDGQQRLWISNTSGLARFDGKNTIHMKQETGLLSKRINDMAELHDGTIVLATDGYGLLFCWNNKIIKHITKENGLSSNICKKLFVQNGYIWVVTNNSVNRVLVNKEFPVESFDFTNSMLDNDVNGIYADRDTAYFATNHGLIYFPNSAFDRNKEVPKVLISAIENNRKAIDPGSSFVLPPGENNLTFFYSAIDFQNNNIRYRYRLSPGGSWTETKSRRLEFSSLEPDRYVFEISARTSNSEWSKPMSVVFVLKAHFWQTRWFMLLILILASFSFYKLAVIVTRKQKNKDQQRLMLRNKILMLEQQALQAMMNPHFVFNVMNSIQHYINTKNTSSANKILTGFARLIRKNLDICTKSYISLEEELEYLTLYLTLEKTRFGEQFQYGISIDSEIDQDETMVPSMVLQPYIENAIWHGLMPKEDGGRLDISVSKQHSGALLIQITDNGIGIDNALKIKPESHESKGMKLTQERINLLNQIGGDPIQIAVSQNGNSGTTIAIVIPER